jgi:Tfp pilus assembly major pilin PilA
MFFFSPGFRTYSTAKDASDWKEERRGSHTWLCLSAKNGKTTSEAAAKKIEDADGNLDRQTSTTPTMLRGRIKDSF